MRRTALKPGKPLRRRTRLRRQSAKARRLAPARRKALAEAKARSHGRCQYPGCVKRGTDGHELLTRARGGSAVDAGNIAWLCRAHHSAVHDRPTEATQIGLLVSRNKRTVTT